MSYLREHDEHADRDGGWTAMVVGLESTLGTVQAEVCQTCGHVIVAFCEHQHNTWHDERGEPVDLDRSSILRNGVTLLCNLCGVDGT